MSKHTPEPWVTKKGDWSTKGTLITTAKRKKNNTVPIAEIDTEGFADNFGCEQEANARRIVACVNACADMEDPAAFIAGIRKELSLSTHKLLTCGVAARHPDASLSRRESDYGGKWNSHQAESVRQLRQERDELLAALDGAVSLLSHYGRSYGHSMSDYSEFELAEAAIAKAKGGAE